MQFVSNIMEDPVREREREYVYIFAKNNSRNMSLTGQTIPTSLLSQEKTRETHKN